MLILPEWPNLGEISKYIQGLNLRNSVHIPPGTSRRKSGMVFVGIRCDEIKFKEMIFRTNFEKRGWKVEFSKSGKVAIISKQDSRLQRVFRIRFYSSGELNLQFIGKVPQFLPV